jgi:hypothetical protein
MTRDRIFGLFKLGRRQHMARVLEGELYMNPLSYFINLEKCRIRGDPNEGASRMVHVPEGTCLHFDGTLVGNIAGPIIFRPESAANLNVFCMFTLKSTAIQGLVDRRNLAFGDTAVVIRKGDEFLRRVRRVAQDIGVSVDWRAVEYIDPATYDGPLGPFRKDAAYSYQSEFRIALWPGIGEPFIFNIGSLRDIACMLPLNNLNEFIGVSPHK